MFSFKNFVAPRPTGLSGAPVVVDVKDRVLQLSQQQLLDSADAYFAKFTTDSIQFKKPFSDPEQSVHLTQHLGLLFQGADLFRGARVLDFGCATGWLSLGMAQMGCDVIGIDVSAAAIKLAEKLKTHRHTYSDGRLEFYTCDGVHLPVADNTVDRIVCFDAFHHVRDQQETLREFSRVLKPGGRIAFVEPGPYHSRTEASQKEMLAHQIIENDVDLGRIGDFCKEAGLNPPEVLVQFQRPLQLSLAEFQTWSTQGINKKRAQQVLQQLLDPLTDTQCFFIQKGEAQLDSRKSTTLGGKITLKALWGQAHDDKPGIGVRLELLNSGSGFWITESGQVGQVKLGVQWWGADGTLVDRDFVRVELPSEAVLPGESVTLEFTIARPNHGNHTLLLDLVAEHVSWFDAVKPGQTVTLTSEQMDSARKRDGTAV